MIQINKKLIAKVWLSLFLIATVCAVVWLWIQLFGWFAVAIFAIWAMTMWSAWTV